MGRVGAVLVLGVIAVVAVAFFAADSLPGDPLHPLRQQMQNLGLADYTLDDVDVLEQRARAHVKVAEGAVEEDRDVTLEEAGRALQILMDARRMLEEVPPPDKAIRSAWIDGLERRATTAIGEVEDVLIEESSSGPI